jgi:uncharacterized protein
MGLAVGMAIGFATRRAKLCTFGAIEDAIEGGDYRRFKILGLALAIAILGTQGLILAGYMSPSETLHVPMRSPIFSIMLGSVMFGFGMALVGTCAFGSLIKVGSGDLRSLIVILVFGTAAFATLRGIFVPIRLNWIEPISVTMPGGNLAGLVEIAEGLTGLDLRLIMSLLVSGILIALVFREKRLHRARRLLLAGVVLGAGVVIGWIMTVVLVDEFEPKRVQSLTFVSPVARGIFATIMGGNEWLDFSAMSAIGVILGASISAKKADEFRWEAFDDHYEMKRHLLGAILIGIGGVLAGGCTIGQGISAGSLLAVSAPIAIMGMIIGARFGIAILVEGSSRYLFRDILRRLQALFHMR